VANDASKLNTALLTLNPPLSAGGSLSREISKFKLVQNHPIKSLRLDRFSHLPHYFDKQQSAKVSTRSVDDGDQERTLIRVILILLVCVVAICWNRTGIRLDGQE
jgi:hypothetical protein